jgi:hypothetical protein
MALPSGATENTIAPGISLLPGTGASIVRAYEYSFLAIARLNTDQSAA